MSNQPKIAVIGAGVVGLCTAKNLQDQGFSVTLFDQQGIAEKCSKGNAGHFATEQVFPLAQASLLKKLPGMLFNPNGPLRIDWRYLYKAFPWFFRFVCNMRKAKLTENTNALKALNEPALSAYKALLGDQDFTDLITLNGSLLTFEDTPESDIEKLYQQYKQHNVAVKWLKGKSVFSIEPNLDKRVKNALLFTDVGHSINPYHLCQHIFSLFHRAHGEFQQVGIKAIQTTDQNIALTTSDNTTHQFDKVIICTGAWSKSLTSQLGFNVPLDTERGYHAMIKNQSTLSRPVASAERQFIITPMSEGLRLAGTVEFAGLDAPENHHRATMLLKHAKALLSGIDEKPPFDTWMGCRPSLPDSLPVIGRSPKHRNVYFGFGHQHLGLTQAAITAKLLTQLCSGEVPSLDLTPYRIDRF
ncbi:FAD-binding oxidoreductase [Pseudoalteromonas sp. MMG013]|uniref:NAD(P)/FAD-dependent oxidoreductase n=1 Tax=unclassified Pseudoalteromonas TaxID=194690 RepID=UPI001B367FF6|nr:MULTISPECIES: FAD-dependent oxidoreductase [unclassified Pseudoalteromonas]MBQ4845971.1 FAD-binding oxidoreductase [Pseudoalteromonas sp. MMG005]MBQ4862427.1 FAD-binding oxidoreductase [Pseudoalteromonas sp. MMG013]